MGRDITDYLSVEQAVAKSGFTITEVVSGGAKGVDRLGEWWAAVHSVPVKKFPADWLKYGKAAGPIRNKQMVDYAEALIAVWDGQSRGTQDMVVQAGKRGLPVYVYHIPQNKNII